ncbi:MAG: hypothetical protein A3I11_02785 [Elusimicrobia bacterium RIFCSPLOWO2_02_FULL_39_32]|nr:MAG: hypothetical protein A3B80_01590 [Elusimicrobia bacterium RIFCSPHIGHO2_02_FULL_39_36]OGR93653.1 MAG: hypothetical protein A3I11_02785 [Elusimicrobia bacterium RIFCSPLOWO2_02_FULL_39_32]OGS00474.1 MAG: hypothetical protein A3G85_09215 [Elusimicrobia bacterium RIFCSPLOWO2_12_FULL_39_28]
MSELRQNLCSKEWVVIAPKRREKPNALKTKIKSVPLSTESYSSKCPFCPNNEKLFPLEEKMRIQNSNGEWVTRVIENKYKILDSYDSCPTVTQPFDKEGIYQKLKGCGSHELVIDSNRHDKNILNMSPIEIRNILEAALQRAVALKKNPNNLITLIFKNYGAMSGQTQLHSHTQIVGSRVVPSYIRTLLHEAEKHFDSFGSCVFCDMIVYEIGEGVRLITQNENYVSFVPFAAGTEHETWILPKFHAAGLEEIVEKKLEDLAKILQSIFQRFHQKIENPDFNFVIRSAPYPLSNVPYYHWHIQLLPRTKIIGGFEVGTRIQVNTILPEDSAKLLRECSHF